MALILAQNVSFAKYAWEANMLFGALPIDLKRTFVQGYIKKFEVLAHSEIL